MQREKVRLHGIKIFADGADFQTMVALARDPMIHGLTTNPTLMRKAGISDYRAFCREVLANVKDKPISFEVFADEFPEMRRQALEIASWGPNVYVKIPITNSYGLSSYELIADLAATGVKLNVTAVLTLEQVFRSSAALHKGPPSIVSVFAGRIADTGIDPVPQMIAALDICRNADEHIELLWASPRELLNVVQADQIGCDIITVTPDLIKKLAFLGKSLKEFSLETVQMFKKDAEIAGYRL